MRVVGIWVCLVGIFGCQSASMRALETRRTPLGDAAVDAASGSDLQVGDRALDAALDAGRQPAPSADFASRCSAPGVILCEGFDNESSINSHYNPPGGPGGPQRASLDIEVKASGVGSLRFEIPPFTPANTSGNWNYILDQAFAEGDTFYVQFRQRFSTEMLDNDWGAGAKGWKQVIFSNQSASCANVEITTANSWRRRFPQMYDRCGKGFGVDLGNGDYLKQWSEDWPSQPHPNDYVECHYQNQAPPPSGGCLFYEANDWMTFYYEVHIGTWQQPNSHVKAWAAREGQPLRMFVNQDPWTAYPNGRPQDSSYNRILLLPYHTGKPADHKHPTAYTWYDDLIVSTQPIAPPSN